MHEVPVSGSSEDGLLEGQEQIMVRILRDQSVVREFNGRGGGENLRSLSTIKSNDVLKRIIFHYIEKNNLHESIFFFSNT